MNKKNKNYLPCKKLDSHLFIVYQLFPSQENKREFIFNFRGTKKEGK